MFESPPAFPFPTPPAKYSRRRKLFLAAAFTFSGVVVLAVIAWIVLRQIGLIQPYIIPGDSMAPAISKGDWITTEGVTYHFRPPQRGEIVVFKTDGLPILPQHTRYIIRLVGLPGDHLRISNLTLYVNDRPCGLRNRAGDIHYLTHPAAIHLKNDGETVIVPAHKYFLLGDCAPESSDSRFWGFVSTDAVVGRAVFCYLPPGHLGPIK